MQGQSCSSDNKAAWGCAWIPWPECLDSNLSSTTYHFCDVGSFTETMTTRGQTFYITPLERRNPSLGSFNWENTREVIYPRAPTGNGHSQDKSPGSFRVKGPSLGQHSGSVCTAQAAS
ncbi:uncharacterized protein LOC103788187 isoform X3 [Callithrix jacchus]